MFTRMDHVAMSVQNIDRCIAFYCDLIGFEKVFDRTFTDGVARLIGVPGAEARVVHLKLGENVLELFSYRLPEGRPPRPDARQSDFGLTHIGFRVDDFWGTYRALQERGVRFLGEPVEIRPGVWVAYFYGAEYEVCEMREIIAPNSR